MGEGPKPECHVAFTSCRVEPSQLETLPCVRKLVRSCDPYRTRIRRTCQCNGQHARRAVPRLCSYHGGNESLTSCDEELPNLGSESANVARAVGILARDERVPGAGVFIHIPDSVVRIPVRHERLCRIAHHVSDIAYHGGYLDFARSFPWKSRQGAMYTRADRPFHRGSGYGKSQKLCLHNATSLGEWFGTVVKPAGAKNAVSWSQGLFAVQVDRLRSHPPEVYERMAEDLVSYGTFSENSHFAERIWRTLWRGNVTLYAAVEEARVSLVATPICFMAFVVVLIRCRGIWLRRALGLERPRPGAECGGGCKVRTAV